MINIPGIFVSYHHSRILSLLNKSVMISNDNLLGL